jgi:Protein of unknown function (DUF2795)
MQNLQNLNPSDAAKYLQGVNFPASAQDVISALRTNGAPNELVQKLASAGEDQFSNQGEVMSTLARL